MKVAGLTKEGDLQSGSFIGRSSPGYLNQTGDPGNSAHALTIWQLLSAVGDDTRGMQLMHNDEINQQQATTWA